MSKYHQGKYTPRNPEKYVGDVSNIVYRSGWEKKFLLWCDMNPNVLQYSSEEVVIPYISPIDGKAHRYFVDAAITVKTRNGEIKKYLIEIKPKAQTLQPKKPSKITKRYLQEIETYAINLAKWEAATIFAEKNNFKFQILTEEHIFK